MPIIIYIYMGAQRFGGPIYIYIYLNIICLYKKMNLDVRQIPGVARLSNYLTCHSKLFHPLQESNVAGKSIIYRCSQTQPPFIGNFPASLQSKT